MHRTHRTKLTATAAALLGLTAAAGTAHATPPGPGVVGTVISRTTVGDTDYVLRVLTIPPGQATGWHYHDGTIHGFVRQGTLSHYDATCGSDGVYPAGTSITERPDYTHIGRNLGTEPLVLEVLYVLPHGAPLSQDAPNPGCGFE
ncbi:cupin domain-containing protein [Streptomyces sp. NPDC091292]|uniref:cupin domain-containing protein n=1 Tax=Streptomyces sp. NPDC091292 TaxID=3365991 RepID=UPI0038166771